MDINDYDFQTRVILLMMVNPNFLHQYRRVLDPGLFEADDHRILARTILQYYDRYNTSPDPENLRFMLERDVEEEPPYNIESWGEYVEALEKVKANGNLDFVSDRVEQFIRHRLLGSALTAAVTHWESLNHDEALNALHRYERMCVVPSDGINFFDDVYGYLSNPSLRDTISTGITPMDKYMKGGSARGELSVVLAPSGVGKTTMLINIGYAALVKGYKVYHFFAEQTEEMVWGRYAARIARRPLEVLQKSPKKYSWMLQKIQGKGSLQIVYCLGWFVSDIRSYIYRHGAPDMIIIDYADKLKAPRQYAHRWEEMTPIYEEMVGMGKEFNCSVWTASQVKERAFKQQKIYLEDAAGAIEKVNIADNVIPLCQTDEEKKAGKIRILLGKIRNAEDQVEIPCRIIRSQMRIFAEQTKRITDGVRKLKSKKDI